MTAETPASPQAAAFDPFAPAPRTSRVHFLYRINPVAKLTAIVPGVVALVFVRDLATPIAFALVAYAVLLIGVRLRAREIAILTAVPVAVAVLGVGLALWVDAGGVDDTAPVWRIGGWTMYSGALAIGFASALRLGAIFALSLIPGLSTTGPDLVRSFVQQLGVPYRVGYTAMAAFRFVPRFRHELDVIRAAHRVRGAHGGKGPFSAIARWTGYVVPLLAGAIRHAERVALAMEARAFGAHPTRTERYPVPFRTRDTVFLVVAWIVTAGLLVWWFPWQLG